MPPFLCIVCVETLVKAYIFKQQCLKAYEYFRDEPIMKFKLDLPNMQEEDQICIEMQDDDEVVEHCAQKAEAVDEEGRQEESEKIIFKI